MPKREAYCAVIERQDPNMADRLWHPAEDGARRGGRTTRLAISICQRCPLRLPCLADALVGMWDDDSIYGGMLRRNRQRLACMAEADGVKVRQRDYGDLAKRRRETLRWLREHPAQVSQAGDSRSQWAEDWRRRKQRMADTEVAA